jgi:hypothetical protein
VRLHGEPGEIGLVADPEGDPNDWFVQQYGGAVMIVEPEVFGALFVDAPISQCDDLEFLSRGS